MRLMLTVDIKSARMRNFARADLIKNWIKKIEHEKASWHCWITDMLEKIDWARLTEESEWDVLSHKDSILSH